MPQHTASNDVICRSLQSAGIPALLKPDVLDRCDRNRPDGITLFPYVRGKSPVLDATCMHMFCSSNMINSAIQARAADNKAESRKRSMYTSLTDRFDFQPIAVETSRVLADYTLVFLRNLGSRIVSTKSDAQERTWLIQRISLAVVRGNAISTAMSCRRPPPPQCDDYLCDSECNYEYCIECLTYCTGQIKAIISQKSCNKPYWIAKRTKTNERFCFFNNHVDCIFIKLSLLHLLKFNNWHHIIKQSICIIIISQSAKADFHQHFMANQHISQWVEAKHHSIRQ